MPQPLPRGTIITRQLQSAIAAFTLLPILLTLGGCYPKRIGPVGDQGKPLTWKEMSANQRKTHMKTAIVPRAGAIFRAWRPQRHAQIDCTLCHGPNARKDDFRMPTDHLPRLSGALLLGPEFEKHPDTTRLKLQQLVPTMAAALGRKPFNLLTRRGFGCYSCHSGPSGPMFGE